MREQCDAKVSCTVLGGGERGDTFTLLGSTWAARDPAPKSFVVAEVDALSLAEDSINRTAKARSGGAAGVPSPGHVYTRIPQELGKHLCIPRHRKRWKRVAPVKGDRRGSAMDAEETYEPVVLMITGNWMLRRTGTRSREGGNKTTHRSKET